MQIVISTPHLIVVTFEIIAYIIHSLFEYLCFAVKKTSSWPWLAPPGNAAYNKGISNCAYIIDFDIAEDEKVHYIILNIFLLVRVWINNFNVAYWRLKFLISIPFVECILPLYSVWSRIPTDLSNLSLSCLNYQQWNWRASGLVLCKHFVLQVCWQDPQVIALCTCIYSLEISAKWTMKLLNKVHKAELLLNLSINALSG